LGKRKAKIRVIMECITLIQLLLFSQRIKRTSQQKQAKRNKEDKRREIPSFLTTL
jgi:hypothetical protein